MSLRLREAADLEKRLVVLENRAKGHGVAPVPAGPMSPSPHLKRNRRGDTTVLLELASGSTVTQAAANAGLSERTVYRRLRDPSFHQRIEALRADMVQRAAALLLAATLLASKTLIKLQNATTHPSVRRRAARDIIEMSQKLRQAAVVEKRLAALMHLREETCRRGTLRVVDLRALLL